MARFKIQVEVEATDIMMANLAKNGVQNVLNELQEHQSFLIELSDPRVAKSYKDKIMGIVNNPMVKAIAGKIF